MLAAAVCCAAPGRRGRGAAAARPLWLVSLLLLLAACAGIAHADTTAGERASPLFSINEAGWLWGGERGPAGSDSQSSGARFRPHLPCELRNCGDYLLASAHPTQNSAHLGSSRPDGTSLVEPT